jgi:hypothetical protein
MEKAADDDLGSSPCAAKEGSFQPDRIDFDRMFIQCSWGLSHLFANAYCQYTKKAEHFEPELIVCLSVELLHCSSGKMIRNTPGVIKKKESRIYTTEISLKIP